MASLRKSARGVTLVLAIVVAGCAASSAGRNQSRIEAPDGAVEAGDLRFDALDPQPLPSGACGLFLWARTAGQPVLVLAALAAPPEARVRLRGRERTLRRTAVQGQSAHGHFETQTYSDGRLTLTAEITFDQSGRLRDGATVQRGVIRMTDSEGFETIIPVGGLVACET